jgi:hypothetical protein
MSWRSTLILSSHLCLGFPSGLFPSRFPTKTLYAPLVSHKCATCPPCLIHLVRSTVYFSPLPCYFISIRPQYSPQHPILNTYVNKGVLKVKALTQNFMCRETGSVINMSWRQRHGSKSPTVLDGNGWSLLYSSHFASKERALGSHSIHVWVILILDVAWKRTICVLFYVSNPWP